MNPAKKLLAAVFLAIAASVVPAAATDYYVSTEGNDANDGRTRGAAFRTIAKAVDAAQDGDTVRVLSGTYSVSAAVSVAEAIAIVGDTGDPADVVVRNTAGGLTRESGANSVDACRVFVLDNAGAVLSGLAVEGGVIGGYADRKGGNVLIEANGGTVTNCILRNAVMVAIGAGDAAKSQAGGAAIASLSANGLITHCVITNNFATRGSASIGFGMAGGSIVHVSAPGVIRDCLVAYNATRSDNFGSTVYLGINSSEGAALMENCTIAGNRAEDDVGDFYPVFFSAASWGASYNPMVRNTLIVGNVGASGSRKLFADAWVANFNATQLANAYGRFANCATDSELPDGLSMVNGGIRLRSGFRPVWNSSVVDAGAEMLSPVGLDLWGNPRVVNGAVDIGCYEYDPAEPGPVDAPEFFPASGVTFSSPISVSLSCTTEGATIRFTLDGTDPTEASELYAEPIVLSSTTTIKARAFKEGKEASAVASANYRRGIPAPPELGELAVTPRATSAKIVGEIVSVGNNLATACDVYLAIGTKPGRFGDRVLIASGATDSFEYTIPDLRPETRYYYELMLLNDASVAMTTLEYGNFTTTRPDDFDYCVSTTGDDGNDGLTRDTAFATIAHAVDVATDNQKICVLAGTYEVSEAVSVTEALRIFGDTGNPADVVVRNTAGPERMTGVNYEEAHRVFVLDNAGAVLAGIAVERGRVGGYADRKGGNILIETNGGTVTNCIIRNAVMYALGAGGYPKTGSGGAGIASLSPNGLITHCVITNNFATRGISDAEDPAAGLGAWGGAAAVHIQGGGILRQSLIAYNTTTNDACASIVFLGSAGTLMENCTIAANRGLGNAGNFYPVVFYPGAAASQNPLVRNTLFFENEGTAGSRKLIPDVWVEKYSDPDTVLTNAYARFVNCATDSILPAGLEMVGGDIRVRKGFRPIETSPTVDAGAEMLSPVGVDLLGKPRVVNKVVDIGCYESSGILPTLLILR
jgi:hypothetical protein